MFCPLTGGNDRTLHHSVKIVQPGSKNNETFRQTHIKDILQNNQLKIFECVQFTKIKERLRKYSLLKETKEHKD